MNKQEAVTRAGAGAVEVVGGKKWNKQEGGAGAGAGEVVGGGTGGKGAGGKVREGFEIRRRIKVSGNKR